MSELEDRIAALPPTKRALLALSQAARADRPDNGDAAPRTAPFSLISPDDVARLPVRVEDAYPLSVVQFGMLVHMQHERSSPSPPPYHNVNTFHLRVDFDLGAFQEAVDRVVARHPIVRTSFALRGYREPLQLVHATASLEVGYTDLRGTPQDQDAHCDRFIAEENFRLFDLTRAPLMRLHVHHLSEDRIKLTLTEPHSISDGWSTHLTLVEIFELYHAIVTGRDDGHDAPLAATYRDFIALERKAVESEEAKAFWRDKLSAGVPTALPRWPASSFTAAGLRDHKSYEALPVDVVHRLRQVADMAGVSLKSVLLAAHLKVVSMLAGRPDVVTGMVFNGRPELRDGDRVRGMFLNTLPLSFHIDDGTWKDLVVQAHEAEAEILPFRRFPLPTLQGMRGRQPLFEIAFSYHHFHSVKASLSLGWLEVLEGGSDLSRTNFPLGVVFALNPLKPSELMLMLEYDVTQLCAEQVTRIRGYYETVLGALSADPLGSHGARDWLSGGERREVVEVLGRGPVSGVGEWTLGGLVERQVRRCPGALAVVGEGGSLSYGELDRRANRLSRRLRGLGVGPEVVVGLCVPRGVDAVVGLLGIVKAGGAYLPLDPAYPLERLRFMIKDAGVGVLVSVEGLAGVVGDGLVVVRLDADADVLACESDVALEGCVGVDDAAYVIYTSGSSGVPKGVVVSHRGLGNVVGAQVRAFGLGCDERVLQFSSLSFDASVFELVMALGTGSTLCVARQEGLLPGAGLVGLLESLAVSCVVLPPSVLAVLPVARLEALRVVVVAGEACSGELVDRWAPGRRFFDAYGPTETTIWASVGECFVGGGVPSIGWPIENVQVYVVDGCGRLVPVGVAGELWVGGVGVARGYLGRAGLTAESFVPDGFGGGVGARLYRTGDVVRQRVDGCLEFVGRVDGQVKVRGFRVEVGEVEAVLASHAGVRSVAVVVRGSALAAFVVADGVAPSGVQLRRFVAGRLPGHMVPGAFWFVDELPLTPNGKLDRRALAAMEPGVLRLDAAFAPPTTELERQIAAIWQAVLELDRVGVDESFFDVGGTSLLLIGVHGRLLEILNRPISLLDMFEHATIHALAEYLTADRADESDSPGDIEQAQRLRDGKARSERRLALRERSSGE